MVACQKESQSTKALPTSKQYPYAIGQKDQATGDQIEVQETHHGLDMQEYLAQHIILSTTSTLLG